MKISGAIFDMDGTLIDSMFAWNDIGRRFLISRGKTPKDTLWEYIKTLSLFETAEYFQTEYGVTESFEDICRGIDALVEPMYRDEVQPKRGVPELLERFKALGIKMCVATATDRHLVEIALERTGLMPYFSAIFTCSEVGESKNSPLIYETALKHLGTPKTETLLFEDALFAMKTARAAGFVTVGVYDESAKHETEALRALSDMFITDFAIDSKRLF